MNNTKRGMELAATISALVFAGIMLIVLLINLSLVEDLFNMLYITRQAYTMYIILISISLIFVIALIVIASLLCKKPNADSEGKVETRLGLSITFIVLTGLTILVQIAGCIAFGIGGGDIFGLLVVIAILVLFVISMTMKHTGVVQTETNTAVGEDFAAINPKINELNKMKAYGFINDEQYQTAVKKLYSATSAAANTTVDAKIAELKKYKELGIIDDEKYKEAVDKIIREQCGK